MSKTAAFNVASSAAVFTKRVIAVLHRATSGLERLVPVVMILDSRGPRHTGQPG